MKTQQIRVLAGALVLGLLLALAVGLVQAQGAARPAGGAQPGANFSVTSVITSAISYQGVLEENGSPVDGSRNMIFRLYSDGGCATQVGSSIDVGSVQVSDGLFSVALPVDPDDFNGQGLWLEVEVGGTKIGCQAIRPAPYALSLRPGAIISDTSTSIYVGFDQRRGSLLTVDYGLLVETQNNLAHGVYGLAHGALSMGVVGSSDNASGYGVYGSNSAGGYAGYFSGDVGQRRTDNGMVKASVYAYCADSSSTIYRSFNNVNSTSITISNGASSGKCTIDFGFDVNDRFWSATSYGMLTQGVSCQLGASNDQIDCYRWSTASAGVNGGIMIIVY